MGTGASVRVVLRGGLMRSGNLLQVQRVLCQPGGKHPVAENNQEHLKICMSIFNLSEILDFDLFLYYFSVQNNKT